MEQLVYVIYAHFEAKKGNERLVQSILTSLVEPTSLEAGCLKYELYSSYSDESKFLLHEYWLNEEAHSLHMTMPYIQQWQVRKPQLLKSYGDVVVLRRAKELFW